MYLIFNHNTETKKNISNLITLTFMQKRNT